MDLAEADKKELLKLDPNAIMNVFPYKMPQELVAYTLSFLTPKELATASLCCKEWREMINRIIGGKTEHFSLKEDNTQRKRKALHSDFFGSV